MGVCTKMGSWYILPSTSVLIGDADCTASGKDLCTKHGVQGYPTIKYFTAEKPDGESYNGGRDFDSLKKFTEETLEGGCDINDESTCDEKEVGYIAKAKGKGADFVDKQLKRLEGMKSKPMKPALKAWLFKRLNILQQLDVIKDEL